MMHDYKVGDRVRRSGHNAENDFEIPEGTPGVVIEITPHFNWIRVDFDGVEPNNVAAMRGRTGHLMAAEEIERVEE